MKKLLFLAPLGALLLATSFASAQSPFTGTWKVDMSKVGFPMKPDMYLLQNGMYACKTCTPPFSIKADGTDQAVSGHPYFDTVAIKVVNDRQIQETDKKNGKVVSTSTTTVSPDGKVATFIFNDASNTNGGPPVTGKGESMLVAKGPAGSHAVSGSWRTTKLEGLSDNATTFTFKVAGGSVTMTAPTGQSYTAKLGGPDAPMMGDPGISSVSVKLLDKNTLEEVDKHNGKTIGILKMTVAPGGKTAKCSYEDTRLMRTTTYGVVKE